MEPLIRGNNVLSAGISAGVYLLGFHKIAIFGLVLNGLDVVGRQVSPEYRSLVVQTQPPLAGLGFVPAVRKMWR